MIMPVGVLPPPLFTAAAVSLHTRLAARTLVPVTVEFVLDEVVGEGIGAASLTLILSGSASGMCVETGGAAVVGSA